MPDVDPASIADAVEDGANDGEDLAAAYEALAEDRRHHRLQRRRTLRSWHWAAEPHLIRDYTRRFLVDSGCAIQRSRLDGWLIKAGSRSAYSPNALALFIAAARDFYT